MYILWPLTHSGLFMCYKSVVRFIIIYSGVYMSKKKSLLTKAAKGMAEADVANPAVRNLLCRISELIYGAVTEEQMEEAARYFDWKCPYTGVDLKEAINNRTEEYAIDHIVPQNREHLGLNVLGNLVFSSKKANSKKHKYTAEEFLIGKHVPDFLKDVPLEVRQARLDKIIAFQKENNYHPDVIKNLLKDKVEQYYLSVENNCKEAAKEVSELLGSNPTNKTLYTFRDYLKENGTTTNTAYSYSAALNKVMKEKQYALKELNIHIDNLINEYSTKESRAMDHGTRYNALKRYKEFIMK